MSEYEALRRAKCGPVIATCGWTDFPRSFLASAVIAGTLPAYALVRDILRWPDAMPGATS